MEGFVQTEEYRDLIIAIMKGMKPLRLVATREVDIAIKATVSRWRLAQLTQHALKVKSKD